MAKKKKEKTEKQVLKQTDTPKNGEQDSALRQVSPEDGTEADGERKEKEEDKDPVVTLEGELKEQKDKYLRLMAEFDNYKRRTSKEYERLVESANERLMLNIIEVRENFERALSMADENNDFTGFLEGMKLIFDKFEGILNKNGLVVFTEVGDEFDPEIHDAMMKTPHDEIPEDHIVQIYEKGYKLKDHVIKHAKVIVSAGIPEDSNDENKKEADVKVPEE